MDPSPLNAGVSWPEIAVMLDDGSNERLNNFRAGCSKQALRIVLRKGH